MTSIAKVVLAMLLASQSAMAADPSVQAVLNVREGGELKENVLHGGTFHMKREYTVPASHVIHDGLFAFEGLGWESDVIGYRLYLDKRFAMDIFGKRTPAPVLQRIGQAGDDYHELRDWGMDIFKVGNTVGMGSLGRLRNGAPEQLQPSNLRVRIHETPPEVAVAEVIAGVADVELTAKLSIHQGSPITRVETRTSAPMADLITGITHHPGVQIVHSTESVNGWAYVGTWGKQSLANDDLGIALFYKPASVRHGKPLESVETIYVRFAQSDRFDYAFGAAWTQDRQGVNSLETFKGWLDSRLKEVAADR